MFWALGNDLATFRSLNSSPIFWNVGTLKRRERAEASENAGNGERVGVSAYGRIGVNYRWDEQRAGIWGSPIL